MVVQQQIDSEVAGVGFSLNPLTNDYDEAVFDAKPGDLIARVAWDEVELPDLRGRARQQPIELDEDVAIRMERSVRFSLFDEYEGSWPAMEKKSYFG